MTWNWSGFVGSREQLRLLRRDLAVLDSVVARVPEKRVAVQAGGNLGLYPKRLAESFHAVYTFEPAGDLFAAMMRNAPEPNIYRFQAALSDRPHQVAMSRVRRDGKPNNHEGITHIAGAGDVPAMRLDDLALPVVDLLQLDLEGWELYALRGAVETLARCRPVLCVEINKSLEFIGISADTVRQFIFDAGYRFVERRESDEVFVPVMQEAA